MMIVLNMEQMVETTPMIRFSCCQNQKYIQTVPHLMDLIPITGRVIKQEEAKAVPIARRWEQTQVNH